MRVPPPYPPAIAYTASFSLLVLHSHKTVKLSPITVCAAGAAAYVVEYVWIRLHIRYLRRLVAEMEARVEATTRWIAALEVREREARRRRGGDGDGDGEIIELLKEGKTRSPGGRAEGVELEEVD